MRAISGAIPEHIRQKIAAQQTLDTHLANCLPAAWKAHCNAVELDQGELTIVADTPAWGTRLRLHSAEIVRQFNRLSADHSITRIRIRCAPPVAAAPAPTGAGTPRRIPGREAAALRALAEGVDDEELAAVLRRLATHGGE